MASAARLGPPARWRTVRLAPAGVALGLLLNVTVVLPRFHTFFTEKGEPRRPGDPSASVDMDFFYDVERARAVARALRPHRGPGPQSRTPPRGTRGGRDGTAGEPQRWERGLSDS